MKRDFDLHLIWKETIEEVSQEINEREREDYLGLSDLSQVYDIDDKNRLIVTMKDKFSKILFQSSFLEVTQKKFNDKTGADIQLVLVEEGSVNEVTKEQKMDELANENQTIANSNLVTKFTFDNFVVTKHNRLLVNAAKAVVLRPGSDIGNPFFVFGGSGLGKTHLVNAIGNEIKRKNNLLSVRYIEAKELARITQEAFSSKTGMIDKIESIKEELSSFDVLIFDDIQFIETKEKTKEIFFHIFNDLLLKDKQVVITADRHPEEMKAFEDRIMTRFLGGFTEGIYPPDMTTSIEIVKQKLSEKWPEGLDAFTPDAISFVAENFSTNIRELEGALNRIALFFGLEEVDTKVTLDVVKDIFKGIKKFKSGRTPATIISEVAKYYGVPVKDIKGISRVQNIALARQVAMYLMREVIENSFVDIAHEFDKDHSTVISSIKKIEAKYNTEDDMHKAITELRRKIG